MRTLVILMFSFIFMAGVVYAAAINYSATLPAATQSTLGANQQLEIQGAATTELRTKLNNMATFQGYSARSGR